MNMTTSPSTKPIYDEQTAQKLQNITCVQEIQPCSCISALSAAVSIFTKDQFKKKLANKVINQPHHWIKPFIILLSNYQVISHYYIICCYMCRQIIRLFQTENHNRSFYFCYCLFGPQTRPVAPPSDHSPVSLIQTLMKTLVICIFFVVIYQLLS